MPSDGHGSSPETGPGGGLGGSVKGGPAALRSKAKADLKRSLATSELVDAIAAQEAGDRSLITKWVMLGAGALAAATFGFLFAQAFVTGEWEDSTQTCVDLLKSVVLPVVMLVLGSYFSRGGRA